jgi:hypothetical protein
MTEILSRMGSEAPRILEHVFYVGKGASYEPIGHPRAQFLCWTRGIFSASLHNLADQLFRMPSW